jgi:NhaP-type Na+/H+ or K+/H+ antiporter
LLFSDASKVAARDARHDLPLTLRLLAIGLPLTIVLGAVLAALAFPTMPVALAALVAAALAPTDAALSAAVVGDERLPIRVRRVLNVESGLNDGIATPVVAACIAATATALSLPEGSRHDDLGPLLALLVGATVGAVVAGVGGRLLVASHDRGWMERGARRLAGLGLAGTCFLAAEGLGGNPFVAAFAGGLAFRAAAGDQTEASVELSDLGSELLSHVIWFVFGASFVLPSFEGIDLRIALYAAASLTVVRMVPVALCLAGSGESRATALFIGWFGPRGLASVIFALLALEELGATDPRVDTALRTMGVVVVASVVAHGVTARPLAARYAALARREDAAVASPT